MTAALVVSLLFTMALLLVHGYFLFGSIPLLILKYDVPMDARFVCGFYDAYFRAALLVAVATAASYAFAGRLLLAAGAAMLVLVAALMRRVALPTMDALRERIQAGDPLAVANFRQLHATSILLNLAQLALIVWALIRLSLQLKG